MTKTPLWSATLNHICIETANPTPMRNFYRCVMGMAETTLGSGQWLMEGIGRRVMLAEGESNTMKFSGFAVSDDQKLLALREHVHKHGGPFTDVPSPMYQQGAFAVRDPDGSVLCFGIMRDTPPAGWGLDGRLQHVVVTTRNIPQMTDYYERVLGFLPSDHVYKPDGSLAASFYRSDHEHHSFAVFQASTTALDHHAYETPTWTHIRDWADHFASYDIGIWWGPGRHGAGNNLFFMVNDPDGNKVEISTELEHMDADFPAREWTNGDKAKNLWGEVWDRV
ncbi:MAG: hypothetical protein CMM47_06950 [Rhodospirillaceae bacterium]|nr:hypothetical protein [Rhodospirillaceae bacterium]